MSRLFLLLISLSAVCQPAYSQTSQPAQFDQYANVTTAMLEQPPADDWLSWRRTPDLSGHSTLQQINTGNVGDLTLAWEVALRPGESMTAPLVHDGIMFLTDASNRLLALDATTGETLWEYQHQSTTTDFRRIGVALYEDLVIVPHNDMVMVALNARTGAVVWEQSVATPTSLTTGGWYYGLRSAPLIANGVIVQGVTATGVARGGFVIGVDVQTGRELWRFYTVARPGEAGGNTWNNLELSARSGGSVWIPGSYDAELDLVFLGTAPTYDTAPLLEDLGIEGISNDALFTNSTLALRPATGELVWYYQHIANDQWDLDWVYERQITELEIDGVQHKAIITAGKMALYDILEASTGAYLGSVDTGIQNMIAAIDPDTGAKTLSANAIPNYEERQFMCPYLLGGRNWQSAAMNPDTKMLYLPLSEVCMEGGPIGGTGMLSSGVDPSPAPRPDSGGKFGRIQAIDLDAMELAWVQRTPTPPATPILSTAGGLIFAGYQDFKFRALAAADGAILWETDLADIPSSFPMTYAVDGKQYLAIIRSQPSRFTSAMHSIVKGYLGAHGTELPERQVAPAILVYALQ